MKKILISCLFVLFIAPTMVSAIAPTTPGVNYQSATKEGFTNQDHWKKIKICPRWKKKCR